MIELFVEHSSAREWLWGAWPRSSSRDGERSRWGFGREPRTPLHTSATSLGFSVKTDGGRRKKNQKAISHSTPSHCHPQPTPPAPTPTPAPVHSSTALQLMQMAASKISCGSIRQVDNQCDCPHQMCRKINASRRSQSCRPKLKLE